MLDLLSGSGETLFLRYKDRLDRVLYSLIRVESEDLAYSLFYAIEAGDLGFGQAAAQNSIGPESKTQGIVGPVDLTTPHPEIAARLRTADPGQLFSPFAADQWYAIIRLEYRFDSEYDDQTRRFLGGLLLSAKSQDLAASLRASYQSAAF
jgi:parvulin-like peptidyl-prolyl isomerase